ncbi:hypothetical protein GCM10009767_17620 [Kocuria aegyptia]|uniref:Uncharacterized protein n=1 Tax=Kocuria aegyptia TaxID=330943 RepID=A0ABP4WS23_9MICC
MGAEVTGPACVTGDHEILFGITQGGGGHEWQTQGLGVFTAPMAIYATGRRNARAADHSVAVPDSVLGVRVGGARPRLSPDLRPKTHWDR